MGNDLLKILKMKKKLLSKDIIINKMVNFVRKSGFIVKSINKQHIKKVFLRVRPDYVPQVQELLGITIPLVKSLEPKVYEEWDNMMEYDNIYGEQYPVVEVNFYTEEDIDLFNILFTVFYELHIVVKKDNFNKEVKLNSQSFYIPEKWETFKKDIWTTEKEVVPLYSINILSYDRYQDKRCLTINTLEEMKIKYNIFVEPDEYEQYCKAVKGYGTVIKLPDNYHTYKQGGIPARNYIKWYSTNVLKEEKHWIVDDNIKCFYRFNKNRKIKITTGAIFKSVEQFCLRYTNVGMAGFNYSSMLPEISLNRPPIRMNGKVFSCILITNKLIDWRGIYNEDIDMALRLLKSGYVNLEFQHVLIDKATSGTIKGGNTTTIYLDETKESLEEKKQMGYKKKIDYLKEQHPDVKIEYKKLKSKDYHHNVDYSPWENNKLEKDNDYDMKTEEIFIFN